VFYSIFGLGLLSDQPVPGLVAEPKLRLPDVRIYFSTRPSWLCRLFEGPQILWHTRPSGSQGEAPVLTVWKPSGGDYFRLSYHDGVEFVIDRQGTQVWVEFPEEANQEYLSTYLLGPVLGFLMRLRGISCLHASAIALGSQAIALIGPAGAGKSTTAAAFAKIGYPVLADDIVALRDQGEVFLVPPASPRLCLWPEAVSHLFGSPDALPYLIPENSLCPEWDKRCLDLTREGLEFQSRHVPLGAIYLLGDRRAEDEPFVEAISGRDAFLTLIRNAYMTYLLDKNMRAQEFAVLGRVADNVVLRRVTPHPNPAGLPRLCEVILDDCGALTSAGTLRIRSLYE
jgi:hypothetical protein